ncbi:hypothetical protein KR76_00077 [Pimelobacter simplex]|uniref:Uncharacterized protein n=1 Tax=Nocardioides simplex TaxID=2045 RepID=A0A0C5XBV8_NOCSI|nr:hypothetical protein KR76_00077 [Pimelobacter simplex]
MAVVRREQGRQGVARRPSAPLVRRGRGSGLLEDAVSVGMGSRGRQRRH